MKRFISLFLCVIFIFSGCSSASVETVPPETIAATELIEQKEVSPPTTVPETISSTFGNANIPETVVFDNGDFKLTAKEIDFSNSNDIRIKVLAENNTDSSISFVGSDFTVNGITLYCNFYVEVAAGKKANDYISIGWDDLTYTGIEQIATIQAQDCYIYNNDTSEKVLDFSFDLVTSYGADYQQSIDRSGQTVFEKDGIIIKYRGIVEGFSGDELEFFIENTTDDSISIYADNTSVNGFMVYGTMVAHAYHHTVCYETLHFLRSDLEENDIDAIEEVCLNFYAYDEESRKKVWTTDEITITGNSSVTSDVAETTVPDNEAIDLAVEIMSDTLAESYGDFATIYAEGTTIVIDICRDGITNAVNLAIAGDAKQITNWNNLVESLKKMTTQALAIAEGLSIDNASVLLNLKNDINPDNALLVIMSGEVIYDIVNSK